LLFYTHYQIHQVQPQPSSCSGVERILQFVVLLPL